MLELKWLWKYMGPKRCYLVIGLFLSAITSGMLVINPMLSQKLIDEVITPKNTEKLLPILGMMMAVQMVRLTLRYVMVVLLEKNSQQMLDDVRTRMYDVIQSEDYRFFSYMRTGDLMTRMTNDLDLIRHSTSWISYNIIDSAVIFTATIVYFFTVNVKLTLYLIIVTPLILLVTILFSKKIHPMYRSLREKLSSLNTIAQENIEGNRVVKAFAREEFEKEKFEARNEEYRKSNLKISYVGAKFQPVIDLLSQSLTITTLLVGGIFMINGSMTAGQLLAFTSMTWALSNPLRNLGMLINEIQRFFASCDMVMEVFYARPSIFDHSTSTASEKRAAGDVEFRNVSFSVGKSGIVQDISFHIRPGQTLGIMGTTGSGKTSLINLMTRVYEPTKGVVLLDGRNLQDYKLSYLRHTMSVAMQDAFLFSDTVDGNIAYGCPDLPEEDTIACAKTADADSFIRNLSGGYETLIGERGVGLSGGQKQRISLARALAMRPSVLILDDTTSAVDMETEQYIQKQLRELDFRCTKIIIAQRISSLQDADQILVMDKGRIIERGTHDELLQRNGFYYHIWALQNNVKEGEPVGAKSI